MAIIQFPNKENDSSKKNIKSCINDLLKDSYGQSDYLEDLMDSAPDIIEGHYRFRNILRYIKRGHSIDEAVKEYAAEGCPPKAPVDIEDCENIQCTECWKTFIYNYQQAIIKEKEGETNE